MLLYSAPLSLFARKVEIALREKGLAYDRVLVAFSQEKGYSPKHPEVLKANPKGQVPVLIDGDLTLIDSTVIIEYLEDAYPSPPLLSEGARERAACRLWDLFADEILLVPVRALMFRNGPWPRDLAQRAQEEEKAKAADPVIASHFGEIDAKLESKDYLCGAFSAADIALFMTVHYARRLGGPGLRTYPRLKAWYERLAARTAFAGIIEEIAAADRALSLPVEGAFRD
ncbi:MAG: glutathione S-transferase family protein [Parvibaculaceae bacterium]